MTAVQLEDIVAHVEVAGDPERPPMVLANSLGTDLRVWDALLPAVEDRFRTIRYDKRGHGLTDMTPGPYTIDQLAGDLGDILDRLGVGGAIVVGLSIGGMIAQRLASVRPDLVRALVLMDTAHKIGTDELWQARIDAVSASGIAAIADGVLERWFTAGFRERRHDDVALWRNMLSRTPAEGYAGCCAAIRDADLTDAARSVGVPTLCIAGDQDGATPPDLVRELSGLIPGARFASIEDAGHLPCVEQPEATAGAIRTFLRDIGLH